jgi:hypothetical protein
VAEPYPSHSRRATGSYSRSSVAAGQESADPAGRGG